MDVRLVDPLKSEGDPRFLESIFNVTIDPNILLLAGGLLVLGFIVFGKSFRTFSVSQRQKLLWSSWVKGGGFHQKFFHDNLVRGEFTKRCHSLQSQWRLWGTNSEFGKEVKFLNLSLGKSQSSVYRDIIIQLGLAGCTDQQSV